LKPGVSLGELIPCGGGVPIPLLKPSLIVGRSPACDITLPFPMVSSKHCQLEFKSGFWHVRDLGSRNGIRVDGIFQLAKYLKPGEILSIAKHRYEIAYVPQSDEAPPEENPFALSLLEKAGLSGRGGGNEPKLPDSHNDGPVRKKWTIDE
jgi:adenylate cyclase